MRTSRPLNPAALPVGTEVWPWRVLALSGRGTSGTVYRAEKIGHEHEGPVALKLASYPLDPRFEQEGELLSRMRHPNVPRLLDVGWWRAPDGTLYPFLVMEWVEGVGLYEWAEQPGRTWGQGVRVLAQVASALAAAHGEEGVHRDVRGENVLVREDGSAVLVGFGAGHWLGARPPTRPGEPPGTPQYWSPESLRFQWEKRRERAAHYEAGPADDVYALGMMAWRLVVGRYPEAVPAPEEEGEGEGPMQPVRAPAQALEGAGRELKELILRMLSPEPPARGSAAEVHRALKRVEKKAGSQAERLLRASHEPDSDVRPAWTVAVQWARERRPGLLVAAAAVVLTVGLWRVEPQLLRGWAVEVVQPTPEEGERDAGTAELADTAVTGREIVKEVAEPKPGGFRLEVPKNPRPGQLRPPCKPPRVAINGGCWGHLIGEKPPCGDGAYEWGEGCYLPVMITSRSPTSDPR